MAVGGQLLVEKFPARETLEGETPSSWSRFLTLGE
jgi:hypothetical protein